MFPNKWKLIDLPKITDVRGSLTFIEGNFRHLPFDIKRVYYLYDVPNTQIRGAHGHKYLQQLMIAISGKFDISLDNGKEKQTFHLNSPSQGLYIPAGTWRELTDFEANTVCVVLASDYYDENDYFRNYEDFMTFINDQTYMHSV